MSVLKVALFQVDIISNDASANCAHLEELIWQIDHNIDLIILPELFNTGFHFSKNNVEPKNFTTFKWMKRMSEMTNSTIVGSILENENSKVFNRAYCISPNGSFVTYDKRHLFVKSDEPNFCTPGDEIKSFNIRDWKIQPTICFDLRFPAWCRNLDNADLFVNIANWPSKRIDTFSTLLKARAIENQTYAVGVNRIGKDLNDGEYNGNSSVYDFKGEMIAYAGENEEVVIVELEKEPLVDFREKSPYLDSKDNFTFDI